MKTKENIKLVTVGRLMKELTELEKNCAGYDVVCWADEDNTCCITGYALDKDGDLCINLDLQDEDGGYDNVEMLFSELGSYDKAAKVYMACCGYYLNFEDAGGSIFTVNDEDEIVGCHADSFGKYEYDITWDFHTEADKRHIAGEERKRRRENRRLGAALVALNLLLACWLACNVHALISHTGEHIAENIMWIVVCAVLLVVGILTLHFDKYGKK